MSATGATMVDYAAGSLKDDYLPVLRTQLNDNVDPVLAQLEAKQPEQFYGNQWVMSAHVGRSSGIGAMKLEGDELPAAGKQKDVRLTGNARIYAGTIGFSKALMSATESERGSWVPAATREMERIYEDLKLVQARDLHSRFGDGRLATCDSTQNSVTTIQLAATTTEADMHGFYEGMKVDIGTTANPTVTAAGRSIAFGGVDIANRRITIEGAAVNVTNATIICQAGFYGTGADRRVVTPITSIVDDASTLHGVAPSAYGVWRSHVKAVNGAITEDVLVEAADETVIKGGSQPALVVTPFNLHRSLAAQLKAAVRFNDTLELRGGYRGIAIETANSNAPMALVRSKHAQDGTAVAIDTDHVQKVQRWDWEWEDEGGVIKQVGRTLDYEAYLTCAYDVATDRRNSHFKLTGLTV